MRITIDVSDENECTDCPWWVIIDPRQMMSPTVHAVGSMITGPFFSRAEADEYLKAKHYRFGPKARVYCHCGNNSPTYRLAFREAFNAMET